MNFQSALVLAAACSLSCSLNLMPSQVQAADATANIELPKGSSGFAVAPAIQKKARTLDVYLGMSLSNAFDALKPVFGKVNPTTEDFLASAGNISGVDYNVTIKPFVDGLYATNKQLQGDVAIDEVLWAWTVSPIMNDQIFALRREIRYGSKGTVGLPNLDDIQQDLRAKYGDPSAEVQEDGLRRYIWEFGVESQLTKKEAWIGRRREAQPQGLRNNLKDGGACKSLLNEGVEVYIEAEVQTVAAAPGKYQMLSLYFAHARMCLEGLNKIRSVLTDAVRNLVEARRRPVESAPLKPRL